MRIGSLFSGIGGLELGLEAAGLGRTAWQVERDPDALRALAHHWPEARRFTDVVGLTPPSADLICGGFPCQDLSSANTAGREGLAGAKSGLWREFARIVGEVSPRIVVVENVGRAWTEWVPIVRGDLGRVGFASVPLRLSPAHLGFPHHRDRVFVVAYPDRESKRLRALHAEVARVLAASGLPGTRVPAQAHAALARDDGLPSGLARLPGNAVVPQVAAVVGLAIGATLPR